MIYKTYQEIQSMINEMVIEKLITVVIKKHDKGFTFNQFSNSLINEYFD